LLRADGARSMENADLSLFASRKLPAALHAYSSTENMRNVQEDTTATLTR
jgi:hypothetical protein